MLLSIVPITLRTGLINLQNLEHNLGALNVKLSSEDVATIRKYAEEIDAALRGVARYPPSMQEQLFSETPEL